MTHLTQTRAITVLLNYGLKMISHHLKPALNIIRSDLLLCFDIQVVVQETQDTGTIRRRDACVQNNCPVPLHLDDLEFLQTAECKYKPKLNRMNNRMYGIDREGKEMVLNLQSSSVYLIVWVYFLLEH